MIAQKKIMYESKNILGLPLKSCCSDPVTGFYRDSYCNTGDDDTGMHTVCIKITDQFLEFSKKIGNDLSTDIPEFNFKALKENDRWCLCAGRWLEAYKNNQAPPVYLESTHEETLAVIPFTILESFAINE